MGVRSGDCGIVEEDELVVLEVDELVVLEVDELVVFEVDELEVFERVDLLMLDEEVASSDCAGLSMTENGNGFREVTKSVVQQSGPPRPCPAAPAQHQLLPVGSQRLTSVKPSN